MTSYGRGCGGQECLKLGGFVSNDQVLGRGSYLGRVRVPRAHSDRSPFGRSGRCEDEAIVDFTRAQANCGLGRLLAPSPLVDGRRALSDPLDRQTCAWRLFIEAHRDEGFWAKRLSSWIHAVHPHQSALRIPPPSSSITQHLPAAPNRPRSPPHTTTNTNANTNIIAIQPAIEYPPSAHLASAQNSHPTIKLVQTTASRP